MEIIICLADNNLEKQLCESISSRLTYNLGKKADLYPSMPQNICDAEKMIKTNEMYIIITQLDEYTTLDKCIKLQLRNKNVWFVLIGSDAMCCVKAVKYRINILNFYRGTEKNLAESISRNVLKQIAAEDGRMGGMYLYRDKEYFFVMFKDIMYIETVKREHCSTVKCCGNKMYYTRKTLHELECILGTHFFRCRFTTIVNISHIKCINIKNRSITMTDEYECVYSKSKSTRIKEIISL